ncbi:hypothetical protein [Rhodoferax sp. U11-2br]|uniref:hypothetical protein n=1 Tax=Rhodoferax sp. U11-2br TaxID=2838878 RepID=UPI001BE68BAB|nr:hypothetical protein [Rhodoferax sp. U11-2br]MBT3065868.1 hypothetical protein [Rhodoferax sp. U11-2br]
MGSISGVSGMRNAWTQVTTQRNQRLDKPFAGIDADSGSNEQAGLDAMVSDIGQITDTPWGINRPIKAMDRANQHSNLSGTNALLSKVDKTDMPTGFDGSADAAR